MPTSPADLKHRLRFEQRAADDTGTRTGDWAEVFTAWAQVTFLRGSEPVIAKRLEGVQPVAIRLRRARSRSALSSAWQAVVVASNSISVGTVLQLISVEPSDDRQWIDLLGEVRHGEQG